MHIKQIGSLVLTNSLFVEETNAPNKTIGESVMSADGTLITYKAKVHTPYITAIGRSGILEYLTPGERDEIIIMSEVLEASYQIIYNDNTTDMIIFAPDKPPTFSEIYTGSCIVYPKITMIKEA